MKIKDIFYIEYPKTLIYSDMIPDPSGISFVSSQGTNNSVAGKVKQNDNYKIYPAGIITVPLKGTVLSAHLQAEPCYVAHQIAVLTAKTEMSKNEKLFYCLCIQRNAYRFSYGRQADKTIGEIEMPESIPEWVYHKINSPIYTTVTSELNEPMLRSVPWEDFRMGDLFLFVKGKRLTKADMVPGTVNFLGAVSENNGVRDHIETDAACAPNCITVNYNGSVGEAFYQAKPFWASDDVNILYAKNWTMNKYNALFLVTVIRMEQYRFSYGRKWTMEKMKAAVIKLPSKADGLPDFSFMESYIRSLPYSDRI